IQTAMDFFMANSNQKIDQPRGPRRVRRILTRPSGAPARADRLGVWQPRPGNRGIPARPRPPSYPRELRDRPELREPERDDPPEREPERDELPAREPDRDDPREPVDRLELLRDPAREEPREL